MPKSYQKCYSTENFAVLFEYSNDRLKCTVYRKHNGLQWVQLRSNTIRRPGLLRLSECVRRACSLQLLRDLRRKINPLVLK